MNLSPKKQNQGMRITVIIVLCLLGYLLLQTVSHPTENTQEIKYSEFLAATKLPEGDPNRITEVTISENGDIKGLRKDNSSFKTQGPIAGDPQYSKELEGQGVSVTYEAPLKPSWWHTLLGNSLPIILLMVLIFFFMRQLQIGGGKAMSFGKSRAKLHENQKKITFEQIAGIEEAKAEVQEIIDFLKDPKKFTKVGGRIPKGVLLMGSPGTGKTILARGIAGEAGVPFFSISGSDFVEMFVGVGASRVRDMFDQAKKNAPCIVFIDEIDAVGRHRGAGMGGGHDEREQTLNQLLVEMDGFEANEGVILIAATNRPDVLDPALLRPGRFDRRVMVPKPDAKGREGILKVHAKNKPLAGDVDLEKIAKGTPGFSGADLESLMNEAALLAARTDSELVDMVHMELAKDKVLMGPERKSLIMNDEDKKNTAYHESGHCIVAKLVPGSDPVHKITIIPRGQALGVTILLPDEDRLSVSKEYAEGMIKYAMGGKAAEEVVFGHQTTGASDDLKKATEIARKMVCAWGMNDKIGPVSLAKESGEVFMGRDMGQGKPYSEKVAEIIDEEVRKILQRCYDDAKQTLIDNRTILDNMAWALLVKEVLNSTEINEIMTGKVLVTEEEYNEHRLNVSKRALAKKAADKQAEATIAKEAKDQDKRGIGSIGALPQGT